jgi:hypothetical protein
VLFGVSFPSRAHKIAIEDFKSTAYLCTTMAQLLYHRTCFAIFASLVLSFSYSFAPVSRQLTSTSSAIRMSSTNEDTAHPFCQLPGDPSLILTTNVDLGDKKMEIMKGMLCITYTVASFGEKKVNLAC